MAEPIIAELLPDEKEADLHDEDAQMKAPLDATAAQNAEAFEHSLTAMQALKQYPKAVFWSISLSMCGELGVK